MKASLTAGKYGGATKGSRQRGHNSNVYAQVLDGSMWNAGEEVDGELPLLFTNRQATCGKK
jgi:hypothetical protein